MNANTTELIMLGTGNAMVYRCYNTCFALRNGEDIFLVDAGGGNGIIGRLIDAGISVDSIHNMFVTHAHTDHILGVIWVIRMVAQNMEKGTYRGKFRVFCHDIAADLLRDLTMKLLSKKQRRHIGERILIIDVEDGQQLTCSGMDFTFFDIHSTKAKQFGFKAVLPNGVVLSCLGDEPLCEDNKPVVAGSNWLMCEAFCLYADRDRYHPYEIHHSTALDAGKNAAELKVGHLLLYHTVDDDLPHRRQLYTEEAAKVYDGPIFVPDDLDRIWLD